MPEELVMKATVDEEWPRLHLTARDQTIKRGDKEYEYFSIERHHPKQEWFVEYQYSIDEIFKEGTRFARPIRASYGGYECYSKDIPSVIDCLEKKFDVKVRIEGATIDQINKVAQMIHEEDVAPKPREIGLFDVMESNSEEVLKSMLEDGIVIAKKAGVGEGQDQAVGEQAMHFVLENFKGIATDLDLEIPNEDWNGALKYGMNTFYQGKVSEAVGRIEVKRKFKEILDRLYESMEYECEKDWGVLPREPYNMGKKSKGEQIADQLWEVAVAGPRREELAKLASEDARKEQASLCKKAAKHFLSVYAQSMRRRVEQLR